MRERGRWAVRGWGVGEKEREEGGAVKKRERGAGAVRERGDAQSE